MGTGSDWIKKKVNEIVNQLGNSLVPVRQPQPKQVGIVKITNSAKTKGQLPDGTNVDIQVVGSPGTYSNGYEVTPGKYIAMRQPLQILSTDGGQKAYIMGSVSIDGNQTYYIKDISTSDDLENPNKGQWLIPWSAISATMSAITPTPVGTNIGDRQGSIGGGSRVGMSKTLKDLMFCNYIIEDIVTLKEGSSITLTQSRVTVKTTILRNCTLNNSTGIVDYESAENASRVFNYSFSATSLSAQPTPIPATTTCFAQTYNFSRWSYGNLVYVGPSRNIIRNTITVRFRTDESNNGHIDMYGSWFSDNNGASTLWLNSSGFEVAQPCPVTIFTYIAITQGLFIVKDVTSGTVQGFNFPTDVEFQAGIGYTLSGVQTFFSHFFINKLGVGSSIALKGATTTQESQRLWLKPEGDTIQDSASVSTDEIWTSDSIRPYQRYPEFILTSNSQFKVFEDSKFLKVTPTLQTSPYYQFEFYTLTYDTENPNTLRSSVFKGSTTFYPWYAIGEDRTPPSSIQDTLFDYTII